MIDETRTGQVSGKVVGPDGQPLAGVEIAATGQQWKQWCRCRSGPDGRFVLEDVPADPDATLHFREREHAPLRLHGVSVFPDECVGIDDVYLVPGRRVHVRVLDERGRALHGATVHEEPYFNTAVSSIRTDGPPWTLAVDEQGDCHTMAFSRAVNFASLRISAEGHRVRRIRLLRQDFERGTIGVVVLPATPLEVRGRVFGELDRTRTAGRPFEDPDACEGLADARVWAQDAPELSTQSDERGEYVLHVWDEEHARSIFAEKDGYDTSGVWPGPDGRVNPCLNLIRSITVRVVEESTGDPLHDARVTLTSPQGLEETGEALGDGRLRVQYHESGENVLVVECPGFETQRGSIELRFFGPELDDVVVAMPAIEDAADEEGDAREACEEPSAADLEIPLDAPSMVTQWWHGHAHNAVNMSVLRSCPVPSRYTLLWTWCEDSICRMPRQDDCAFVSVRTLEGEQHWWRLGADGEAPARLPVGSIEGRVEGLRDAARGATWLVAFQTDGPGVADVRIGADGQFRIDGLPAGDYALRANEDTRAALYRLVQDHGFRDFFADAEPWLGVVRVAVVADEITSGVVVDLTA